MPSRPGETGPGFALRLRPSPGLVLVILLGWLPLILLARETASGSFLALPLVMLVTILGAISAVRSGLLSGGRDLARLKVSDNRLVSLDSQGVTVEWIPGHNSRLFARLAWLDLTCAGSPRQRRRLIVTDLPLLANVPAEDFRRLKVWLRLGASYH